MAMGVPTPGFLMVSLYNPVDKDGDPLRKPPGAPSSTIQTHLCLLPNQAKTYFGYIYLILFCVMALAVRAFLVPVLKLTPFALELDPNTPSMLPLYKEKVEDRESHHQYTSSGSSGSYAMRNLPSRVSSLSVSRTRGQPIGSNGSASSKGSKRKSSKGSGPDRWGWGETRGPKIDVYRDDFYESASRPRSMWRAASARPRMTIGVVGLELWATIWRVAWMVILFWGYLAYKG
jgi:ethanolamine phosphate phosphodiesterase